MSDGKLLPWTYYLSCDTYQAPYHDPSGLCLLCTYLMALLTHELWDIVYRELKHETSKLEPTTHSISFLR